VARSSLFAWQPSWHYDEKWPRTPEAILDGTIKCAQAAMEFKPIGIAFHGGATDILFRAGKIDLLKTYVDRVHDMGTLAESPPTTPPSWTRSGRRIFPTTST